MVNRFKVQEITIAVRSGRLTTLILATAHIRAAQVDSLVRAALPVPLVGRAGDPGKNFAELRQRYSYFGLLVHKYFQRRGRKECKG